MSLFSKKKTGNEFVLPYGIVLMTAFFLSMIIFSICYGNRAYMNEVMGRDFEKNIIGQTSFMAAGFGLLLTLDYGLTFSIDRKEKERLVDIISITMACLELIFVVVCSIIYIVNWQGYFVKDSNGDNVLTKEGFEFILRIITMIVIYLVMGVNILSRVPKFRNFENLIEGHGSILIYLSIIGLIGLVDHFMMWTVLARESNKYGLVVNFVMMGIDALMIAAPFVLKRFVDEKTKGASYGLIACIVTGVLILIFTLLMVYFYKQEKEHLVYREFYWALFIFTFDNILRIAGITYYGIVYKKLKQ